MPDRLHPLLLPIAGLFLFISGLLLWRLAPGTDRWLFDGLHLDRAGPWTEPARLFTATGGLIFLGGLTLAVSAGLIIFGERRRAIWLIATVAGARLTVEAAKWLFARDRPPLLDQLTTVSSHSFPSAHATGTMTVWLALALAFPSRSRTLLPFALAIAVSIGWSRIALGVHWPSDVIGGFGLAFLMTGIARLWLPPSTNRLSRDAG